MGTLQEAVGTAGAMRAAQEAKDAVKMNARRIRELEIELQDLREQQEMKMMSKDPIKDVVKSAVELKQLGEDLTQFAFESLATVLWPWPVDVSGDAGVSLQFLPDLDLLWQLGQGARDAFDNGHAAMVGTPLEQVQVAGAAALNASSHWAWVARGVANERIAAWLCGFSERHPQHGKVVAEWDPLLVACGFLALCLVLAYNLQVGLTCLLRIIYWVFLASGRCCCRRCCCHCRTMGQLERRRDAPVNEAKKAASAHAAGVDDSSGKGSLAGEKGAKAES